MRAPWLSIALAAVLAIGVASPQPAAAHTPLSYSLTLTAATYSGTHPSGTIAGLFGGVGVDGTYSRGGWHLDAYGHRFAAGTYTCVRICRFNGMTLAGRAVAYAWSSPVPTWDAREQVIAGEIGGLFASRYDWSALVAAWAEAKGLPLGLQTRITVDAQMGM